MFRRVCSSIAHTTRVISAARPFSSQPSFLKPSSLPPSSKSLFYLAFLPITAGTLTAVAVRRHWNQNQMESSPQQQQSQGGETHPSSLVDLFFFPAVHAKSPDTPEYLIPHYLRSTRSRFNHYASIRDKKKKKRYMTPKDFVAALLALSTDGADTSETLIPDAAVEDLTQMFEQTDANHDGRISYKEFSLLRILMVTPLQDFEAAFGVFDEEQKGGLTKEQFTSMVKVFGDEEMRLRVRGGLVDKCLFAPTEKNLAVSSSSKTKASIAIEDNCSSSSGPAMAECCTFDTFCEVVHKLHRDVHVAEFRRFDPGKTGTITPVQFGKLLTDSILGRHLPFYFVENLRKLKAERNVKVSLDTWLVFCELLDRADVLAEALMVHTATGLTVKPDDFARCVKAASEAKTVISTSNPMTRPLTSEEVQLLFQIFDKDGDGTLEYDEFISVAKGKAHFHVLPTEKSRENIFSRAYRCGRKAFLGETMEEVEE